MGTALTPLILNLTNSQEFGGGDIMEATDYLSLLTAIAGAIPEDTTDLVRGIATIGATVYRLEKGQ